MPRYIALLRAINVGGHVVKMEHLRGLCGSLGLKNVETFIASGNVIFDSPSKDPDRLEDRLEQHLAKELGYDVATFLRTPAELATIAAYAPFGHGGVDEGDALYVNFLKQAPPADAARKLMGLRTEVDDFHLQGREAYWLCRTRISESRITGGMLERTVGMPATSRNVTTVRRLADKYAF